MNDVLIASNSADAAAVETVRSHHAELAGALTAKVSALTAAVRNGGDATSARDDLAAWCAGDLLPHARAEEKALYPAALAIPRSRMLVEAMIAEHQVLTDLADQVARATDALQAVGAATALQTLFDSHLEKENERVLPVLAEASDVSLAELLKGMHEALAADEAAAAAHSHDHAHDHGHGHGHGHSCTCGEHDAAGDPELDTRLIPHAIRHATIFGALDAVRPGGGLVISASHDPLPLLAQIEQRTPGAFAVEYLERGPETWRLRFARQA
jgi:uncharacterized protein (DUF2249 family)